MPLPPLPPNLGDTLRKFLEGYKGLPDRMKRSPKPQPMQWFDRFPVMLGGLMLFWPLGLLCIWLTKRLDKMDQIRLSVAGVLCAMLVSGLSSAGRSAPRISYSSPPPPAAAAAPASPLERVGTRDMRIHRQALGERWPFPVAEGIVRCDDPAVKSITFTTNGTTYAVNEAAASTAHRFGWARIESLWRGDQDPLGGDRRKIDLTPIIDLGSALAEASEEERQNALSAWKARYQGR